MKTFIRGVSALALGAGLLVMGCDSQVSSREPDSRLSQPMPTDDATITTQVKAKIAEEAPVGLGTIGVETNAGVVQLSGVVASADVKQRAAELARGVNGVRDVVNNLTVQAS